MDHSLRFILFCHRPDLSQSGGTGRKDCAVDLEIALHDIIQQLIHRVARFIKLKFWRRHIKPALMLVIDVPAIRQTSRI